MGKQYQTSAVEASTLGLTIPEEVSVALPEIAESAKEGLLALAVGAGLQVLQMMEESVTALAGPRAGTTPTAPPCGTVTSRARIASRHADLSSGRGLASQPNQLHETVKMWAGVLVGLTYHKTDPLLGVMLGVMRGTCRPVRTLIVAALAAGPGGVT